MKRIKNKTMNENITALKMNENKNKTKIEKKNG